MNNKNNYIVLSRIMKLLSLFLFVLFLNISVMNLDANANNELIRTRQKIKKLKKLEQREMNKLNRNQMKLENASKELNYSKAKFETTETKLEYAESEYSRALSEFNSTSYNARKRLRQIYKKQTCGLVTLLLSATDINDLLDKIYYQKIISRNDRINFDRTKEKARYISNLKYSIEMQRDSLKRSIANIDYQQKTIQKAISENERYINKLKTDRATYERAERELAKQSANLESMISRTSKKDNTVAATGTFLKPIGGPITSSFGYRIHPIFKSKIFHSGIDIGGPNGGAVRAANSGKVIYAGWYGGYGKVVIIDHGKYNGSPTTTLYAHLSSYSVSVGQYLVRGQILGREGTTGYSTGPHVHFEVRINGQPRNPLNYI